MKTSRFQQSLLALACTAAWLALATSLPAQTNRSASTTNRSSAATGPRQYTSNTMLGDALIQIDPESRSLVVVTDEETQTSIAKVINNLDHPKPQVLIKVVFVEVTIDKDIDVGIDGSYKFNIGSNGSVSGTSSVETLFGLATQTAGTFGRLTSDNWSATLHLLAQKGKAQVLSRPSIMARNNQQAVIVVGQEVPMITNSQITTEGQTINTIQYKDVGIILRVTPFITSDKTVEMIVAPEISSLSEKTVPISSTASAPVINKRSAETVVVTPNATTVVIGGLMQKESSSTIQKIPILGDIPILGLPFRRVVKTESRSELLIFLTPYIVESTQKLKDLTLKEANSAELTRETLTSDEIKNNLDTIRLMPQSDPAPQVRTETIIETATKQLPTKR